MARIRMIRRKIVWLVEPAPEIKAVFIQGMVEAMAAGTAVVGMWLLGDPVGGGAALGVAGGERALHRQDLADPRLAPYTTLTDAALRRRVPGSGAVRAEDAFDVEAVAALVKDDPSVKGMWVVPTYASPTGATTTQEVAAALTSMPTAAPDFKIFWDNAYAVHHLTEDEANEILVNDLDVHAFYTSQ